MLGLLYADLHINSPHVGEVEPDVDQVGVVVVVGIVVAVAGVVILAVLLPCWPLHVPQPMAKDSPQRTFTNCLCPARCDLPWTLRAGHEVTVVSETLLEWIAQVLECWRPLGIASLDDPMLHY